MIGVKKKVSLRTERRARRGAGDVTSTTTGYLTGVEGWDAHSKRTDIWTKFRRPRRQIVSNRRVERTAPKLYCHKAGLAKRKLWN